MLLRKRIRRLTESRSSDFMSLMRKALHRARLNEAMECDEELDAQEGLDEFADETGDGPDDADFDSEDLDDAADRPTVTITIPVDASIEEITDAIAAAQAGEGEDLDDEADLDAEAEAAADEAGLEDTDMPLEEDEEGKPAVYTNAPSRKPASGTYTNSMTVKSNISPKTGMGKPATRQDASPRRVPATGTYKNEPTVKSSLGKDSKIFR